MPEEVVRGRSLDEIRQEWAGKWGCLPEELTLDIIDKPGILSRQWKVRITWADSASKNENKTAANLISSRVNFQKDSYLILPGTGVNKIIPPKYGGEVLLNGKVQQYSFAITEGDKIQFVPVYEPGELTWELENRYQGISVVAKVLHKSSGRHSLPEQIESDSTLEIEKYLKWEDLPSEGVMWEEERLNVELEQMGVVYGKKADIWKEILEVKGKGDVVAAEATLPVPPEHAKLEDFVGQIQPQEESEEEQKIDFFASKVQLVKEGAVLARKIPGIQGVPGKDVFGKTLPTVPMKDFQLRPKKNTRLSEDGLEIIAACDGHPVRMDEITYMVENVYVLNQDVDLATGSIDFPGDVYISGNVQDSLHVSAGGKIEILGMVSHAEIKAEKGVKISKNVLGGKIIVGEKYVKRSGILRLLRELHEELTMSIVQTEELLKSEQAKIKPEQLFKRILERNFPDLPKKAAETEGYLLTNKDELITQDLLVSVRTAKHFLSGLGPLDPKALPMLTRVNKAFAQFVENIALEVPEKLTCSVDYVQGAIIETGGIFQCTKGAYNSQIRAQGDVKIEGVCRGGKIISEGNVYIKELGGSGVSTTFVQITGTKKLEVGYCHANVIIAVDKEIVRIEEPYKLLEIFRERGLLQIEKIKAHHTN